MEDRTLGFYDSDPEGYSEKTFGRDVSSQLGRFAAKVSAGGRVLDLGCGSGRDTLSLRRMGFRVTPVDGSEGMCRMARRNTGAPVRRLLFSDLDYDSEFEGVWACASLLHVPMEELPGVLELVKRALVPGGVLYTGFKEGSGEGYEGERWYTRLDADGLRPLLEGADLSVMEVWRDVDADGTVWVSALSEKV